MAGRPKRRANPSLLTVAALGAGAYYLAKSGKHGQQHARPAQRVVRHWGALPPAPTRQPDPQWPYLVWAFTRDLGWYDATIAPTFKKAVFEGYLVAGLDDDPKFAVQKWLGNRWSQPKVYERPAGGWPSERQAKSAAAEFVSKTKQRNPTPAYHRSRGEAEMTLAEDSYRKAQALLRRGDSKGSHDALVHAHRMAALAENDLLDGASPKAAQAKRLAWWKAYKGLAADKRRNPRHLDPQGRDLGAVKRHFDYLKKEAEEGRVRASAEFAQKVKTVPLADWTTVEGQMVLRSGASRFVAVPRNGKRTAASFDIVDLKARELVTTLKKDEVYKWLWAAAQNEQEGGNRNPRKVRNPYLSKFIPPGGKGYQYVYSEEDVAKRHAKKAQRIEALKHKEASLRAGVRRDVAAGDDAALAVGLILATYERPGNAESAREGHYGVTGWECRHLSLDGRKATIDYIGKSGVHQTKVIKDPYLVQALATKAADCGRKGSRLVPVSASAVNRYLDSFDVSAKDLRTFGANTEMQKELTRARAGGPDLSTLKTRDVAKTLKAEFNAALGIVAARLGHTTSVLRKQYLVQGIEPLYLQSGTVLKTFV